MNRKVLLCTATGLVALALACSKSSPPPTSPSGVTQPDTSAAADGSTLKVSAPVAVSPVSNAKPDQIVLTLNNAAGKYQTLQLSYQFEITTGASAVYTSPLVAAGGTQTSVTPSGVEFVADQAYSWRARAVYQGANGPWSTAASFRGPDTGFMRGNEVRDPLTNGRTVGDIRGPVQFIQGVGARLLHHSSHIRYALPQTLQEGQISMMILGADEGSPGDKSKVFSMQEGPDEGDITDDDYRMTAELRGRDYGAPGAVTFRIIPGDGDPRDGHRIQLNFDSSRWYFWRFSWRTGRARLEVKRDSETGPSIYDTEIGTGSHPYRPVPHLVYLGAPAGRAGLIDATLPGGTYKNVYVGPNARPVFPQ